MRMDDRGLTSRMLRAAKLDPALYEEVEADTGALGQAMLVVVLASLAAGIGGLGVGGTAGLLGGVIGALIGWVVWAAVIYVIGTRLLPGHQTDSDVPELLRTLGFASAPGVIRVFGVIPGLGALIVLLASVWMLFATVIAIRQALDYETTGRAVLVCVIGWVASLLVFWLIVTLFGLDMTAGV